MFKMKPQIQKLVLEQSVKARRDIAEVFKKTLDIENREIKMLLQAQGLIQTVVRNMEKEVGKEYGKEKDKN